MESKYQVFISYRSSDVELAQSVFDYLTSRGLRVFFSKVTLQARPAYREAIDVALEEAQVLIAVGTSAGSLQGAWVEAEWGFFISELRSGRKAHGELFCYCKDIDSADLPPSLRHYPFIKHSSGSLEVLAVDVARVLDVQLSSETKVLDHDMARMPSPDEGTGNQTPFRVVDTIKVMKGPNTGEIQLCIGDLSELPPEEAVDVLVVSAFRDEYSPVPGSLIGSLDRKGVSLEQLAKTKQADLRDAFSCWLSREISVPQPGIQFRRILCFEPSKAANAPGLVGDIYRSLAPFVVGQDPIRTVATPLVATGFQRADSKTMLKDVVEASIQWMSTGLPLSCLKIVCLPRPDFSELASLFAKLKTNYALTVPKEASQYTYDFFISYAHTDEAEISYFTKILQTRHPQLRLFIDRKEMSAGAAWQREIFESLDDCRKVITFYSPSYLKSKVCLDEFNIGLCRHRESKTPVLVPVYLYSANLPTYMRLVQFVDCREFERTRLASAIDNIVNGASI
jgi:hypothetical protein